MGKTAEIDAFGRKIDRTQLGVRFEEEAVLRLRDLQKLRSHLVFISICDD